MVCQCSWGTEKVTGRVVTLVGPLLQLLESLRKSDHCSGAVLYEPARKPSRRASPFVSLKHQQMISRDCQSSALGRKHSPIPTRLWKWNEINVKVPENP